MHHTQSGLKQVALFSLFIFDKASVSFVVKNKSFIFEILSESAGDFQNLNVHSGSLADFSKFLECIVERLAHAI